MGRPKKVIDKARVLALASHFCTVEEIAADEKVCSDGNGVSKDTLERRFAAPIKKGRDRAKRSLRARQYEMAMGKPAVFDKEGRELFPALKPNVTLLIWLGKQYLGQSDKFAVGDPDDFPEDGGYEFVRPKAKKE